MIVINGKKYKSIFLNGIPFVKAYYAGKLVFTKNLIFDGPYLLASLKKGLLAAEGVLLSYTNTPQVLADTLSGQEG